jgi:hypothetical protein
VLAVLLRVPTIVVPPPEGEAEVITGKFCMLFTPVSVSHGSLDVTPSRFKSMPSPPFEKMELPLIASPVTPKATPTPRPPLPAFHSFASGRHGVVCSCAGCDPLFQR